MDHGILGCLLGAVVGQAHRLGDGAVLFLVEALDARHGRDRPRLDVDAADQVVASIRQVEGALIVGRHPGDGVEGRPGKRPVVVPHLARRIPQDVGMACLQARPAIVISGHAA
ncbi:hypothetical protein D3C87_1864220 [compost metagenome]